MPTTTPRAASTRTAHRAPGPVRVAVLVLLLTGGAGLTHALATGARRDTAGATPLPYTAPAAGVDDAPGPADALDPELERRFAEAQRRAAADGVALTLTSGLRTPAEQQRLVDEAVERYGVPEAYRWVLPPDRSAHVQGLAIDVGPTAGAYWLQEHGPDLGLCPTYANEVWHFELLAEGASACPEPRPDSSWAW